MTEALGRMLAASASMKRTFARIREVAATETSVVIQGETGTGKELVAEALHEGSPRASGPFVVVDCAAVARELVESELFGHVRGAFTGAVGDREGAFESARAGTLFIDELGELPLDLQPRLLRALERREVKRVGDDRTRPVDCRVVAATNRDLRREVEAGRFREDLFYRLAVVELSLPPLRERPDDIELLTRKFLEEVSFFGPLELGEATLERLKTHAWPGNVRELRNTIERAATLSDGALRLPSDFGEDADLHDPPGADPGSGVGLRSDDDVAPPSPPGSVTRPLWEGRSFKDAKQAVTEDFERGWLEDLLERHGGNVSAAAREAGVHRNIIHRMIAKYRA
ncbi:MAG: sigma-54 dependent transcriptional regulator [Myxococcota bacterium]